MKLKELIKNNPIYIAYNEHKIDESEKARFRAEYALPPKEKRKDSMTEEELRNDFYKCVEKTRIGFSEYYYQYEFYRLSEAERNEFITRAQMQKIYRKLVKKDIRMLFTDKVRFLKEYSGLIHRKWMLPDAATTLDGMLSTFGTKDIIAKPLKGSLGQGIFVFNLDRFKADQAGKCEDFDAFIKDCVEKTIFFEERLSNCEELAAFNASSLNTVRICTVRRPDGEIELLGSFLRMGRKGAIVDNAHNGGLFAHIDVHTGTIDSDAISTDGDRFSSHPDSNAVIKGFKIPRWEEMAALVVEAMECNSSVKVCGWDVALTDGGEIEIIEGNHAPDVDVMQSTVKKGLKKRVESLYQTKVR